MKRKIKKLPIIILSIILLSFVVLGYFFVTKKEKPVEKTPEVIIEKPKEEIHKLSLIMVGDALIHSGVYNDAYVKETDTYDFRKQIDLIKPIVQKDDLAFDNQETILGGRELGLSNYPQFNSP